MSLTSRLKCWNWTLLIKDPGAAAQSHAVIKKKNNGHITSYWSGVIHVNVLFR